MNWIPFSQVLAQGGIGVDSRAAWAPVALLLVIAILFAVVNIAVSILVGPRRTGAVKESTYESGMTPIGDTHKRFNVRFYLLAILFVAFDVEIVFLYPWATAFPHMMFEQSPLGGTLLLGMIAFVLILLLGYIYELGKGAFQFD
jgi:NADH-quinone oxidoreductase subunit A